MKIWFKQALKQYKGSIVLLCLFTFVASILFPVSVRILSNLLETLNDKNDFNVVIFMSVLYLCLYATANLAGNFIDFGTRKLYKKICVSLKSKFSYHLMRAEFWKVHTFKRGEIISFYHFIDDIVFDSLYPITQILYLALLVIFSGIALWVIHPILLLTTMALLSLWGLVVKMLMKSIQKREEMAVNEQKSLNSFMSDILVGFEDIIANSLQDSVAKLFYHRQNQTTKAEGKSAAIKGTKSKFDYCIISLIMAVCLVISCLFLGLSAIQLTSVYFLINILYTPILSLGDIHISFASIKTKMDQIDKVLQIPLEDLTGNRGMQTLHTLDIVNLCIAYDQHIVIKDISFRIKIKDICVLWGESGSGKSSIMNGLLGFVPIESGNIFWNEQDITKNRIQVRTQVSYVAQELGLFSGTIAENIACGHKYSIERMVDICKQLSLLDVDMDAQSFLNKEIIENGKNISVGQAQRLCIARVIYQNRPICFFDEPTSSQDYDNGNDIINIIKTLSENAAIVISTHDDRFLSIATKVIQV